MLNCPYAKRCNGCQLQNLEYKKQLSFKQVSCIRLLGKFCHIDEIVGMENPLHYRNKSQTAFFTKNGMVKSGLYQSVEKRITQVDNCLLEYENTSNIVETIKKLSKGFKIKPYDYKNKTGVLRHLLIRQSLATKEIMVVLVVSNTEFKNKVTFTNELIRRHSEITTVVLNQNDSDTFLFLGEKEEVLFGKGYITDILCGLKFKISPKSFYQINHDQTEKLYTKAKEYADLKGDETVIDAYCGTGTIGLTLADKAKRVIGVEINKNAVLDAKENAKLNGTENAEFIVGDAGDFMVDLSATGCKVDVVIADPPRAGCNIKFLNSLVKLSPQKMVYISCNIETLSRDLSFLTKNGYKVLKITPIDMFPYTKHIECCVLLCRGEK